MIKKSNHRRFAMLVSLIIIIMCLCYVPQLLPMDANLPSDAILEPPKWLVDSAPYIHLGTDDLGRDIFSRILLGAKSTLGLSAVIVTLSLFVGSLIGMISAVFRGIFDMCLKFFIDMILALPPLILAVLCIASLAPGKKSIIITLSLINIANFAKCVRGLCLAEMTKEYMIAAKSFGYSKFQLICYQLWPSCLMPIIIQSSLAFSQTILNISVLGFLRLGLVPPDVEWGMMLADAYQYIESAPFMVFLPGIFIFFSILFFNLMGEILRDALASKKGG